MNFIFDVYILFMTKTYFNSEIDPDLSFNLSDEDVLRVYLDSFISMPMTTTVDDDTSLSTGAIAGIVIATIVAVISVMLILAFSIIYCCRHHKQSNVIIM